MMKKLECFGVQELNQNEKIENQGGLIGIFLSMVYTGYCYESYKQTGKLYHWE